jgi:hypothetical protein
MNNEAERIWKDPVLKRMVGARIPFGHCTCRYKCCPCFMRVVFRRNFDVRVYSADDAQTLCLCFNGCFIHEYVLHR